MNNITLDELLALVDNNEFIAWQYNRLAHYQYKGKDKHPSWNAELMKQDLGRLINAIRERGRYELTDIFIDRYHPKIENK